MFHCQTTPLFSILIAGQSTFQVKLFVPVRDEATIEFTMTVQTPPPPSSFPQAPYLYSRGIKATAVWSRKAAKLDEELQAESSTTNVKKKSPVNIRPRAQNCNKSGELPFSIKEQGWDIPFLSCLLPYLKHHVAIWSEITPLKAGYWSITTTKAWGRPGAICPTINNQVPFCFVLQDSTTIVIENLEISKE